MGCCNPNERLRVNEHEQKINETGQEKAPMLLRVCMIAVVLIVAGILFGL